MPPAALSRYSTNVQQNQLYKSAPFASIAHINFSSLTHTFRTYGAFTSPRREANSQGSADFREGHPRISKNTDHALDMLASGMSYTQISEATGISKSTLSRRMRTKKKNVADIIKNNV